jgi:hypothetical protein
LRDLVGRPAHVIVGKKSDGYNVRPDLVVELAIGEDVRPAPTSSRGRSLHYIIYESSNPA